MTFEIMSCIKEKLALFENENDQWKSLNMLEFCDECVIGKQSNVSFSKRKHDYRSVLEYVHTDVCGLESVASLGWGCAVKFLLNPRKIPAIVHIAL